MKSWRDVSAGDGGGANQDGRLARDEFAALADAWYDTLDPEKASWTRRIPSAARRTRARTFAC